MYCGSVLYCLTCLFFCLSGLVLNPDPESESEASEVDDPDDPVIPSPEMDDVKGKTRVHGRYLYV